jgi:hypothetical protein
MALVRPRADSPARAAQNMNGLGDVDFVA